MKIIGITGGVGSGKSRVLEHLQEVYDAIVCQADHVAWDLQQPGEECYEQIVETFGEGVLNDDQTLSRARLGAIVFADSAKLKELNQIMHPAVKKRICELIQENKDKGHALFVIEAALLLEENYSEICDELWYIYSDEIVRRARLKLSRDYSDDRIDAMMQAQISEEKFRQGCHKVIDNNGAFHETCEQIKEILG